MDMKNFSFLFLIILIFGRVNAQTSLSTEILDLSDSSEVIINNGRNLIIQKVQNGNFSELQEIVNYVKSNVDTNLYLPFYVWEEQLIAFASHDLNAFFLATREINQQSNIITPPNDNLAYYCREEILDTTGEWIAWYESLLLTDEEEMALRIFMGFLGIYPDNYRNAVIARKFKREYPTSKYLNFVRSVVSNFNRGKMEYVIGSGINNFYGNIADYCPSTSIFFIEWDGFANRFYYSLFLSRNLKAKLLSPLTVTDDDITYYFEGDEKLNSLNSGFKFGWLVFYSERILLYPYAILSSLSNTYYTSEADDNSIDLGWSGGLGAGFNIDYTFLDWNAKNKGLSKGSGRQFGIRINFNYSHYFSSSGEFTGEGLYLNTGLFYRFDD